MVFIQKYLRKQLYVSRFITFYPFGAPAGGGNNIIKILQDKIFFYYCSFRINRYLNL